MVRAVAGRSGAVIAMTQEPRRPVRAGSQDSGPVPRSHPANYALVSWRVAVGLFALGVITRIPFATDHLYAPDSVLYARAMERFDPLEHRPQPPGYLWYVLLLRAVGFITQDPNRAMTIVSALAGAAAITLVYLLATRLYDERTGRVAALFMLTAATFWAYGGLAYPYTLLAALTTITALAFWLATSSDGPTRTRWLLGASALWGIAIGFRSDLAIFIAPVWLVAALRSRLTTVVASAAIVVALTGVWLFASAAADGGLARFVEALREQGRFVDERYSVLGIGPVAIYRNAYELARFLGRGLYFLIPLVAVTVLSVEARRVELRDRWRTAFIVTWTFAPLPIYVLVHVGDYGYIFSMLPGMTILAARGAIALAKGLRMPRTFKWIVAAVALGNAAIFLISNTPISARDIAREDQGIGEKTRFLEANLAPDRTVVVTAYDAVLLEQYLPKPYVALAYDPSATPNFSRPLACASTQATCAGPDVAVVLWDDLLRAEGGGWQEQRMPHGGRLRMTRATRGDSLRVTDGLGVAIAR
jgi:4-amino-4-deoxy-L-arabinose transferase-like glycosyltransferase